jgi:hypothetical protein
MQENPLLAIRGALHIERGLELRILIITNETTEHTMNCVVLSPSYKWRSLISRSVPLSRVPVHEKSEKSPMSNV